MTGLRTSGEQPMFYIGTELPASVAGSATCNAVSLVLYSYEAV
jgi:hypothetical protein